jgi:hypothetical protein
MQDEGQQQPQEAWVYKPGATAADPGVSVNTTYTPQQSGIATSPDSSLIAWTASEYVANPKNGSWFALLAGASAAVAVIVYILTSDVISTVVVGILGILVGVFAARPPHVLEYSLDTKGIKMGSRFYPYHGFKSFSVVEDGALTHVSLLPLKRFMPPIPIHYPPDNEESIIHTLADYLPYEEHKRDMIENFSRRIRF